MPIVETPAGAIPEVLHRRDAPRIEERRLVYGFDRVFVRTKLLALSVARVLPTHRMLRERGRTAGAGAARLAERAADRRSRAGISVLSGVLRRVERAIPVPPRRRRHFQSPHTRRAAREHPSSTFGSRQVDYVRAAKARGIRSVLAVGSWDHLTTKGLIHELPDRIIVWNELQRTEAVESARRARGTGHRDRRTGILPLVRDQAEHDSRCILCTRRSPSSTSIPSVICVRHRSSHRRKSRSSGGGSGYPQQPL
jgi:hypothetical protein